MSYEDTGIVPKLVLLHLERRRLELINFIVIKLFLYFFDICRLLLAVVAFAVMHRNIIILLVNKLIDRLIY